MAREPRPAGYRVPPALGDDVTIRGERVDFVWQHAMDDTPSRYYHGADHGLRGQRDPMEELTRTGYMLLRGRRVHITDLEPRDIITDVSVDRDVAQRSWHFVFRMLTGGSFTRAVNQDELEDRRFLPEPSTSFSDDFAQEDMALALFGDECLHRWQEEMGWPQRRVLDHMMERRMQEVQQRSTVSGRMTSNDPQSSRVPGIFPHLSTNLSDSLADMATAFQNLGSAFSGVNTPETRPTETPPPEPVSRSRRLDTAPMDMSLAPGAKKKPRVMGDM